MAERERILRVAERRALADYMIQFYVAVAPLRLDPGWAMARNADGMGAVLYWDAAGRRWISRAYDGGPHRIADGWQASAVEEVADWVSVAAAYARLRREVLGG